MSVPSETDTHTDDLTDAYLRRIGLDPAEQPGLEAIVAGHNRSIPFETIDPVCGVPVHDLTFEALSAKLVDRRRGGYCYEHNLLLGHMLRAVGHEAVPVTGRVVWGSGSADPDDVPARTHQVLLVTPAGSDERLLVDVGFGGQTLSSPLRLEADVVQPTRHEPSRLRRDRDAWVLESLVRERWEPLYRFWEEPVPYVDLQMGSWYVSTLPTSGFVRNLVAARVTDEARLNLSNDRLTVHAGGGSERRELRGVDEVLAVLHDDLLVDVDDAPALPDALARILRDR